MFFTRDPNAADRHFNLSVQFNDSGFTAAHDAVLQLQGVEVVSDNIEARVMVVRYDRDVETALRKVDGIAATEKFRVSGTGTRHYGSRGW